MPVTALPVRGRRAPSRGAQLPADHHGRPGLRTYRRRRAVIKGCPRCWPASSRPIMARSAAAQPVCLCVTAIWVNILIRREKGVMPVHLDRAQQGRAVPLVAVCGVCCARQAHYRTGRGYRDGAGIVRAVAGPFARPVVTLGSVRPGTCRRSLQRWLLNSWLAVIWHERCRAMTAGTHSRRGRSVPGAAGQPVRAAAGCGSRSTGGSLPRITRIR